MELEKIPPEKRIYMDETGIERGAAFEYGYSLKGHRCYGVKSGKKSKRISIIAALRGGKLFAPMSFDGMCDRFVVISWLKHVLLPVISKGYTIVMDNAKFHKSGKIAELIAAAGCKLLFLPPYSPRLNPIENHWSPLKTDIKKSFDDFLNPHDAVDFILNKKCS